MTSLLTLYQRIDNLPKIEYINNDVLTIIFSFLGAIQFSNIKEHYKMYYLSYKTYFKTATSIPLLLQMCKKKRECLPLIEHMFDNYIIKTSLEEINISLVNCILYNHYDTFVYLFEQLKKYHSWLVENNMATHPPPHPFYPDYNPSHPFKFSKINEEYLNFITKRCNVNNDENGQSYVKFSIRYALSLHSAKYQEYYNYNNKYFNDILVIDERDILCLIYVIRPPDYMKFIKLLIADKITITPRFNELILNKMTIDEFKIIYDSIKEIDIDYFAKTNQKEKFMFLFEKGLKGNPNSLVYNEVICDPEVYKLSRTWL